MQDIKISNDKSLLQIDKVYNFLKQSYWANKRPMEKIKKSIENSICYGVYIGKCQIGFARIITDRATMYWLCDVFIEDEYRGSGLGKELIKTIVDSEELKDLFGYLGTRDAHEFYEQYTFKKEQDKVMSRLPEFLRE